MNIISSIVRKVRKFIDLKLADSIPERKESDCSEMSVFIHHIDNIELRGDSVANVY